MAAMREKVLYFEPADTERAAAVGAVLVRLGVRLKRLSAADAGQTVGCLLGRHGFDRREQTEPQAFAAPLLVLDGFTDKRLDILLRELKKQGIAIPYKAVVTETNLGWLLGQLYDELAAERAAMQTP